MAVHQRSQSAGYQTNNNNNYYSSHNYNNSANNLHINYSPMPSPSPGPSHSRSPTPVTYSSTSPNNQSNYSYGSSNNTHSSQHQQNASWHQQSNQNQKNQNMRQQYAQNHHNRSHSACSVHTANYNNFNYQNYQMSLQQSSQKQISPKNVSAQIYSDQRELFQQQATNNMNKNQFASTGQLIRRKHKQNDDLEIKMTHETTEREIKMRQQNLKHKLSESINPKKKLNMQVFVRKIKQKNVIIYESWLNKKGKINKAMRIRYCKVYKDRKLKYFRRADDKQSAGFIHLQSVFAINMLLPKLGISKEKDQHIAKLTQIKQDLAINIKTVSLKNNEFGFELVTSKRIWTFSCKNGNIFKNWMNVMKDLCFGKTIYNGYLMKTGSIMKTWKRRFFVIYDLNEMRYFENETLNVQKGKINLNKVSKIVGINGKKYPYSNCIELHTSERIWILASNSDENREKWMNVIRNVMYENEIAFEFILPENSNELSYYKME